MTDIPNHPRSLPLLPVRVMGLRRLLAAIRRAFGSRSAAMLDISQCSDHLLRDMGAIRSHRKLQLTSFDRMV